MLSSPTESPSHDTSTQPSTTRPLGITILAILQVVGALLALAMIIFVLPAQREQALARLPQAPTATTSNEQLSNFVQQIGTNVVEQRIATQQVSYAIAIPVSLLFGWGLWKLRSWARIIGIVLYALGAFLLLSGNFVTAIFSIGWLIYLTRPHVREAFSTA